MNTPPTQEQLNNLYTNFKAHGGVLDNLEVRFNSDIGFHCCVLDPDKTATVLCPNQLLVDIDDIEIGDDGLYINNRTRYEAQLPFLDQYFSLHFGRDLIEKYLQEKADIDKLTHDEREILKLINLPNLPSDIKNDMDYVRMRILRSHNLRSENIGNKVIMPMVTFLNHDIDGASYIENKNGITVSGRFKYEAYACYHRGDTLSLLWDHNFAPPSDFSYSLPMQINFPNGKILKIYRDFNKYILTDEQFRWPVISIEKEIISTSWFPLYFRHAPKYPVRFARHIAITYGVSSEFILHALYNYNFNQLLQIVFKLKSSTNNYVQNIVPGVEKHLEQIVGIKTAPTVLTQRPVI